MKLRLLHYLKRLLPPLHKKWLIPRRVAILLPCIVCINLVLVPFLKKKKEWPNGQSSSVLRKYFPVYPPTLFCWVEGGGQANWGIYNPPPFPFPLLPLNSCCWIKGWRYTYCTVQYRYGWRCVYKITSEGGNSYVFLVPVHVLYTLRDCLKFRGLIRRCV